MRPRMASLAVPEWDRRAEISCSLNTVCKRNERRNGSSRGSGYTLKRLPFRSRMVHMGNALQELAWRYLEKLYELSEGGLHPEVDAHLVKSELGFSSEETRPVAAYLESKDLISWKCRVPCVRITTRGIDEMQNSYAQKETRVLKVIYDLSEQNTAKPVFLHQLESELEMGWQQVTGFCKGLDEKDFVNWPPDVDAYLYITRRGIDAIQSLGKPKQSTVGDSYTLNVQNLHVGVQQGPGNTQNIQISVTNNPEFDQAIAGLLQLIQAARLADDEIEKLKDEVIKLNRLALSEPKPGLLEKAKARIDVMKVGFEGAKLLVQAAPYLHTAWDYFKAKHS